MKILANNKRARYDYFVGEKLQAGVVLKGNEAASLREGGCSLTGAYVVVKGGEAFVCGMKIAKLERASLFAADPDRAKKLLLHKSEIESLERAQKLQGLSTIPLSVCLDGSLIKLEIALCKPKKKYDKRQSDAKRSAEKRARAHCDL